ncbi:MAG: hypothetical protein V2I48_11295 [Xanthomonadales bacterium]|jgi:hypothetical protein|nr:hypothetical protein [Xanthomonadales bacterium]
MPTEDFLDFVVNRAPDRAREIHREYARSDSFRTLCGDFRTCAEALARWKSSDAPGAPERVVEYTQSLRELELEIEEWLR